LFLWVGCSESFWWYIDGFPLSLAVSERNIFQVIRHKNHIAGVMVSTFASSVIDRGFTVFTLTFYLKYLQAHHQFYRPEFENYITLMTINSNHQNSKHDDVPNIMWTSQCQLCIREDQNASIKKPKRHFQSFWNSSDLGGRKSWGLPIMSVMPVPMSDKHFWMICLLF
jgi:hypothetical protein